MIRTTVSLAPNLKKCSKCENCTVRMIAFCGVMEHPELNQLESLSKDRNLEKNEHAFLQGDKVTNYYNIRAGSIKIYKLSQDGRKQIIGFLFPGDFMGMSHEDSFSYSAESLEKTILCQFNKVALENFFIKFPAVENKILNLVNYELSAAQDQIFLLGKCSAKERLLQFFYNISKQREKLGWVENPIHLPMPRSDIANFLGLTVETVSRSLSELKSDKIIKMVGTNDIFLNVKEDFIS